MTTASEDKNLEERLANNDRAISPLLSSGIITNPNNVPDSVIISQLYRPSNVNVSPLSPAGLAFTGNSDLSNGLSSRLTAASSGITDFIAYNPYIHHDSNNGLKTINIMNNVVLASQRFEIYSRQYRN